MLLLEKIKEPKIHKTVGIEEGLLKPFHLMVLSFIFYG
jgi:hypothetical protein